MNQDNIFQNPVDKITYVAEGGWKSCQPDEPRPLEKKGRIYNAGIRLLTTQEVVAERTTVESLATFIQVAESSAQDSLKDVSADATVLVQFRCSPGTHAIQLAHQGSVTQDQLQLFYENLLTLDALPVPSGEVAFQITIQVDPLDHN